MTTDNLSEHGSYFGPLKMVKNPRKSSLQRCYTCIGTWNKQSNKPSYKKFRAPKNFHPFKGRKLHVIYLYLIAVLFFMNVKFPMETNIWPLVLGISKNVT